MSSELWGFYGAERSEHPELKTQNSELTTPHHLREIPLGQIDELEREIFHSRALLAHLPHEVVVEDQGGDRGGEACRGVHESLGDSGRHRGDRGRSRVPDRAERLHDSPDRPEETDERA